MMYKSNETSFIATIHIKGLTKYGVLTGPIIQIDSNSKLYNT